VENDGRRSRHPLPCLPELEWFRDGFAIYELEDGTIVRAQLVAPMAPDPSWACAGCGYEVPDHGVLRRHLTDGARVEVAVT
jgi:hypothetical protein